MIFLDIKSDILGLKSVENKNNMNNNNENSELMNEITIKSNELYNNKDLTDKLYYINQVSCVCLSVCVCVSVCVFILNVVCLFVYLFD